MIADLVITEKMDGENTTIHRGGSHARSPDSRYHSSRDWLKAFAAGISPQLADGERIVGENLYARHSIGYDDLPSYFLGFAWIIEGEVQSWDLTLARFRRTEHRSRVDSVSGTIQSRPVRGYCGLA
ncbi:RNA ligase family protein [Rhizobium ruizarguesonis]|uniref:RNA ligase family protein n=1 Tax=Rhizobium ruizarguesonis TaxID=2081791 RepID=A0ACD5ETG0_9HYPH